MNVATVNIESLKLECLFNDELHQYLLNKFGTVEDYLTSVEDQELREEVSQWIIGGSEV